MTTKQAIITVAIIAVVTLPLMLWLMSVLPDKPETPDDPQSDNATVLGFLDDFTEYGYTAEQIEDMRTILTNVGVTELTDLEIGNVSYGMQVVKGVAFSSWPKEVHIQFNIENGVLYYVHLYCPSYMTENHPTYLQGLEDRRAELYYDAEGGYLKKIDWENKVVVDY